MTVGICTCGASIQKSEQKKNKKGGLRANEVERKYAKSTREGSEASYSRWRPANNSLGSRRTGHCRTRASRTKRARRVHFIMCLLTMIPILLPLFLPPSKPKPKPKAQPEHGRMEAQLALTPALLRRFLLLLPFPLLRHGRFERRETVGERIG
jgi:hypothetical protein